MKYLRYLLALAALTVSAHAQTRYDVTMTVDSVQRDFIVVRPSGAVPAGGYPVVFMFHGTTGDGEQFYNHSGWKEKGQAQKFLTVFPSSLEYCFLNDSGNHVQLTKWNDGEAQQQKCPGEVLADDVHFVRHMVDTIRASFPVDTTRIYASGFSNGGGFASKLAVEMSDVFAAVAEGSGFLNELDSAAPVNYIPIALILGDLDHNFTTDIGLPRIPFNDSCLLLVGPLLNRYRGAFNLADSATRDSSLGQITYLYNVPASNLLPSTQFTFTLLKNMTHEFPNGINYPVAAADYFWPFFVNHPMAKPNMAAAPVLREPIAVYPNPASNYLIVSGKGEMTLTLTTMLGERAFSAAGSRGSRIPLPDLPRGQYLAQVSGASGRSAMLIVLR